MKMKYKKITTSSDRIIEIYDDVFPQHLRHYHILFVENSKYQLGTTSTLIQSQKNKTFFQSRYSEEDIENFNFNHEVFEKKFENYSIGQSWVLASSPLSTYYYHTDRNNNSNGLTLLYYVNTTWDKEWGGETLFTNDYGECEIAVQFKPGRVVIFDSLIEHKPSAISMSADEFRFIFVIQFVLNQT